MSKLMLSHDLPKDRPTQLKVVESQDSHSHAKIKPNHCFGYFLWIFQFCVMSAGLWCRQQTKLADLAKRSKWKDGDTSQESQNPWAWAKPETRRALGIWAGKNKGELLAPLSGRLMFNSKWAVLELCGRHSESQQRVWWAYDSAGQGPLNWYKRKHGMRENDFSKKMSTERRGEGGVAKCENADVT